MATYKQTCIHCGSLTDRDAQFCPTCGSSSPFNYHCPTCLTEIKKGQAVCQSCGRPLYIVCPLCGNRTFVQENCEYCRASLMYKCPGRNCGAFQFFENEKCTACGQKVKPKHRVLTPTMTR